MRAQLLDSPAPTEFRAVVSHLTLLQHDQTAAVAPHAPLAVWSRLGSACPRDTVNEAFEELSLIDLKGHLRPAGDVALYRAEMAEWPGAGEVAPYLQGAAEWVDANDGFRRDLLAELRRDGPLTSRALPDTAALPWRSSGWNDNRNVVMMLELMTARGEVAVAGREGREKLWDLASRVYPDDDVVPSVEALRTRNERRLRSLGIARVKGPPSPVEPGGVETAGEEAVVDGVKGSWRVDPSYLAGGFTGRTAILSPLDRLVFDRKRMEEIFEFDYQLEMYKPAATRRWGYWAMPVLDGDRLIGETRRHDRPETRGAAGRRDPRRRTVLARARAAGQGRDRRSREVARRRRFLLNPVLRDRGEPLQRLDVAEPEQRVVDRVVQPATWAPGRRLLHRDE